jgi:hypothetical protein
VKRCLSVASSFDELDDGVGAVLVVHAATVL